jgi:hypothetical protein
VARRSQDDEVGSDLAQPVDAEGVLVGFGPAMTALADWCIKETEIMDEDRNAAMEAAVARALAASDPAEALKRDLPIAGQTLCTRAGKSDRERVSPAMILYGFTIGASEFQEGFPFYANMECGVGSPPERRIVNIGGPKVLATLKVLRESGEWPQTVMISATKTRAGNTVLDLFGPDTE